MKYVSNILLVIWICLMTFIAVMTYETENIDAKRKTICVAAGHTFIQLDGKMVCADIKVLDTK